MGNVESVSWHVICLVRPAPPSPSSEKYNFLACFFHSTFMYMRIWFGTQTIRALDQNFRKRIKFRLFTELKSCYESVVFLNKVMTEERIFFFFFNKIQHQIFMWDLDVPWKKNQNVYNLLLKQVSWRKSSLVYITEREGTSDIQGNV